MYTSETIKAAKANIVPTAVAALDMAPILCKSSLEALGGVACGTLFPVSNPASAEVEVDRDVAYPLTDTEPDWYAEPNESPD